MIRSIKKDDCPARSKRSRLVLTDLRLKTLLEPDETRHKSGEVGRESLPQVDESRGM